jgi:uncharacterized protein (TIGR03118 family)
LLLSFHFFLKEKITMKRTALAARRSGPFGRTFVAVAFLAPVLAGAQYSQHNLVSDGFVAADHVDPLLINPWGMSFSPTSPFWVADQGTSVATLYTSAGASVPLVPGVASSPTGTVFNGTSDFQVSNGTNSAASLFLFAGLDGNISGWNPGVSPNAVVGVSEAVSGAAYTGLAIQTGAAGNRLYAADFSRGAIDMFNGTFGYMGSFSDTTVDAGYSPFNVQSIGSNLFVEYAKVGADGRDQAGIGLGFVDEFDADGHLVKRIASHGALNAPWGVTLAPSNFGTFSNDLLVGNFGDGEIHAFDPNTGAFLGTLDDASGNPIVNSGLWSLHFGNGANGANANSLYFTAGLNGEHDGLFGRIDIVPEPATFGAFAIGLIALLKRKRK